MKKINNKAQTQQISQQSHSSIQIPAQLFHPHQKDAFLEEKCYFSHQIKLEIPNVFGISRQEDYIPGFENPAFNQKILKNFNKKDILIKMKTNFLKRADNHEFQLIFYLALTFENEKKYQNAIDYYMKFLNYVTQLEHDGCIAFCHNRIGINFFMLQKYDLSLEHHLFCLQKSAQESRFFALYNYGLALRFLARYEEALQSFHECLEFSKEVKDKHMTQISLVQKGICEMKMERKK